MYLKQAPHLAIPAIIDLKHAPRLGDAGSSYIFEHTPHLAIPDFIDLKVSDGLTGGNELAARILHPPRADLLWQSPKPLTRTFRHPTTAP